MKTTTKSGKNVTVRIVKVGANFGICAVIVAGNGRVIGETDTRPMGCEAAAESDGLALAARI